MADESAGAEANGAEANGDAFAGVEESRDAVTSDIKMYEKRMLPANDGKINYAQTLQTKEYSANAYWSNSLWKAAKPVDGPKNVLHETRARFQTAKPDDDDDDEQSPPFRSKVQSVESIQSSCLPKSKRRKVEKHTPFGHQSSSRALSSKKPTGMMTTTFLLLLSSVTTEAQRLIGDHPKTFTIVGEDGAPAVPIELGNRIPVCTRRCNVVVTAVTTMKHTKKCVSLALAVGGLLDSWSDFHALPRVVVLHDFPCVEENILTSTVTSSMRVIRFASFGRPHFDKRFEIFLAFLQGHTEVRHVLLIDGADGKIVRDPFMAMRKSLSSTKPLRSQFEDSLWTQLEWRKHGQSHYMMRVLRACLGDDPTIRVLHDKPILNVGVIGGSRGPVLRVLDAFVTRMTTKYSHCLRHTGVAMVAFNEILYVDGSTPNLSTSVDQYVDRHVSSSWRSGVHVRTGQPFTHTFRNCPDTFVVNDGPLHDRSHSSTQDAHPSCAYSLQIIPANWTLQTADDYTESHCKGYSKRTHFVPHRVKCNGVPFAVLHKATLYDATDRSVLRCWPIGWCPDENGTFRPVQ